MINGITKNILKLNRNIKNSIQMYDGEILSLSEHVLICIKCRISLYILILQLKYRNDKIYADITGEKIYLVI